MYKECLSIHDVPHRNTTIARRKTTLLISIWPNPAAPMVHTRCSCEHHSRGSGWHIAVYYCWIVVSSGRPLHTWLLPWKQNTIPQATGCHLSLQCKYEHIKALLLVNHTKLLRLLRLLLLLITSCIGRMTSGKWRGIRVNCLTHRYFSILESNLIKSSNNESSLHHSLTLLCWVVQVQPQPAVSNGWSEPVRLLDDDRVCLVSTTRGSL